MLIGGNCHGTAEVDTSVADCLVDVAVTDSINCFVGDDHTVDESDIVPGVIDSIAAGDTGVLVDDEDRM
jgi:hypothetical protein